MWERRDQDGGAGPMRRRSERLMDELRDRREKTNQWKKREVVFQPPSFHLSRQMAS